MAKNTPSSFVTEINEDQAIKIQGDLTLQGFELSKPAHTHFSAKKKGISVTAYLSGKLMVQGKDKDQFIEFYLEPEILKNFQYSNPLAYIDRQPRIGIDEAGKGDFFGPLCIAGVYASEEDIEKLTEMRLKDPKTLTDKKTLDLAKELRKFLKHSLIRINPEKYNQLYQNFKNLNHLLAWGHTQAISNLTEQTGCKNVIIDQFAKPYLMEGVIKRKGLDIQLTQKVRAEEDVVVAAAAALARAAFLEGLEKLGKSINMELPKGASSKTKEIGKKLLLTFGKEGLSKYCKTHFKTFDEIVEECLGN